MAAARKLYLVIILALAVLALAGTAAYVRQRAIEAATCETPAPPPKPATPPPNLPGFAAAEVSCGLPAEAPKSTAAKK